MENICDSMREKIVEKSIAILRSYEMNDDDIKKMLMKDFLVSSETIDRFLKAGSS